MFCLVQTIHYWDITFVLNDIFAFLQLLLLQTFRTRDVFCEGNKFFSTEYFVIPSNNTIGYAIGS